MFSLQVFFLSSVQSVSVAIWIPRGLSWPQALVLPSGLNILCYKMNGLLCSAQASQEATEPSWPPTANPQGPIPSHAIVLWVNLCSGWKSLEWELLKGRSLVSRWQSAEMDTFTCQMVRVSVNRSDLPHRTKILCAATIRSYVPARLGGCLGEE